MKRFPTILVLALTVLLLMAGTASASTVIRLDLNSLVANSDVIVVAQVIDIESALEEDGRVYTSITFRADESLKGHPGKEFSIRQVGGRVGDIATYVPGMPDFHVDERVFLFLSSVDSHPVVTGMAQGKFQIAVGPDGETDYVIPRVENSHLISPDQAPPRRGEDGDEMPSVDLEDHENLFDQVHQFDTFRRQVEGLIAAQRKDEQ